MTNSQYGYMRKTSTERWTPQVELSGPNQGSAVPGQFIVDPYLPVIGVDPEDGGRGIVIPAGRFVAVGNAAAVNGSDYKAKLVTSGNAPMTLHEGFNLNPAGMSVKTIYKQINDYMIDGYQPYFRKGFLAEVPHVLSVNNAHGELKTGDRVTGYNGSTLTATPTTVHRGKPVKWTAKRTYVSNRAAGTTHLLASAAYAGFQPQVVATFNTDGEFVTDLTAAFSYSTASGAWLLTLSGSNANTVTTVMYDYGQDADQIAGEVTEVRSLVDVQADDPLHKYVESGPYFDIPPAAQKVKTTTVALSDPEDPDTGETPTTVTAGRLYRVANYPMSIHHPVTVYIQGTVIDDDGVSTEYTSTWYTLPTSVLQDFKTYFLGKYHTVHWNTGLIEIAANITVTDIRVVYSYVTDPRTGAVLWGQGVDNLTDGWHLTAGTQVSGTTVVPNEPQGIPAHLNYSDVVGALRVFVH